MTDQEIFCCAMRRYFTITIVGTRPGERPPTDVADYIIDFENLVIAIKHCPFCGKVIDRNETRRIVT